MRCSRFLSRIPEDGKLADVGDVFANTDILKFTQYQQDSNTRYNRIYVSAQILSHCSEYDVSNMSFSDNSVVQAFEGPKKRSRFQWKLWKLG